MTSARETRPESSRIADEPIHDEGGGEARRLAPPWASSEMNEEDDRRGVNAVSRRRRPGINGVPAVISRSGARAPTAACTIRAGGKEEGGSREPTACPSPRSSL